MASRRFNFIEGQGAYADRSVHPFPDIVLLDINMPRRNGFEVLDWIRADSRYSRLVVHILTSSMRQADVDRAYNAHANSYIVKPTQLRELVDLVRALHQWHQFVALPRPELPRQSANSQGESRMLDIQNNSGTLSASAETVLEKAFE